MRQYYAYIIVLIFLGIVGYSFLGFEELYSTSLLLDIIPHFFAGAAAGLFFAEFIRRRVPQFGLKHEYWVVALVFLVGVIWEIYEITTNSTGYRLWEAKFYADTFKDFVMDIGGALLSLYIARAISGRLRTPGGARSFVLES